MLVSRAVLLFAAFIASPLMASVVEVGTCSPLYVQFTTIQAAINASPAGTTVAICPGIYPEQVVINKKLSLKGLLPSLAPITASGAVIVPPLTGMVGNATSLTSGNPIAAQIYVHDAIAVTINNLTIDGNNNLLSGCGAPTLMGIYYQNASGTISQSGVLNERMVAGSEGCQSGDGIFVQSGTGTSAVSVTATVVQNYQKNGITGNEPGTTLTVSGSTVIGQGPTLTNAAAENGIQIGFGAAGAVTNNTVMDDVWAGDPSIAIATGILVYASSSVTITGNTVGNSQSGIILFSDSTLGSADGATIANNKVSATHVYDGIDTCSDGNLIKNNTVNSSDASAIHVDDECLNPGDTPTGNNTTVQSNIINVACAGILMGGGTGNNYVTNTFYNVSVIQASGNSCTPPLARTKRPKHHFQPARG